MQVSPFMIRVFKAMLVFLRGIFLGVFLAALNPHLSRMVLNVGEPLLPT